MSDNVVPFGRRGRLLPAAPLPAAEQQLHPRARRAAPAARALAAEQAAAARAEYATGQIRQRNERLIAGGKPVPARITLALNHGEHYGPDVDLACGTWEGNPDGDVDMWELALAVPSAAQVEQLAELTGFPPAYFYLPIAPGPLVGGPASGRAGIIACGPRGCTWAESDYVDERGVLHYGGEPPRTLPAATQTSLPISAGPTAQKPAPSREKAPNSGSKAPSPRKNIPASGEKTAPPVQQEIMPRSRLADEERAALRARLDQAKKKWR